MDEPNNNPYYVVRRQMLSTIEEFVNRIERRNEYCSLEELNQIITLWTVLPDINKGGHYDSFKDPRRQIMSMWKDLKKYKYKPKYIRYDNKIETDENYSKQCIRCLEIKNIIEFTKNVRTKDSLSIYCKTCQRMIAEKYKLRP